MSQGAEQFDNVPVFTGQPQPMPPAESGFFQPPAPTAGAGHALASVDEFRAIAEVQASMAIAKRFPRDEINAFARIMKACQRKSLAAKAVYAYPRGKKQDEKTGKWVENIVSGPSIRLAEVLANAWGNIDYGYREIGGGYGYTDVETYAFDKESNARSCRTFRVIHKRKSGKNLIDLTDPRDIYELVANQAARRIRSCILQIIPGDVTEEALKTCVKAKISGEGPLEDRIKKMVVAFQGMGVTPEMLERYMGHVLDVTIADEVNALLIIYQTIKDGEGKREDFFELHKAAQPVPSAPPSASPDTPPVPQAPEAATEKTQLPPKTSPKKQEAAPASAPVEKSAQPAQSSPPPQTGKTAPKAPASAQSRSALSHDPHTGEVYGESDMITCPDNGKKVDERSCSGKRCYDGCPQFM
jgi:hypothetical protein